ncbi:MAG: hypothetical protein JSR70_08545 [Proteobacteria bacterium]|nr:hypothetical protein [Pseudomonadota bacterium]
MTRPDEVLPELPFIQRFRVDGDIAYPISEDPEGSVVDYDDHCSAMHNYAREAVSLNRRAGVPDGWVMVPREPNQEMANAGAAYASEASVYIAAQGYRAMLSASPQPVAEHCTCPSHTHSLPGQCAVHPVDEDAQAEAVECGGCAPPVLVQPEPCAVTDAEIAGLIKRLLIDADQCENLRFQKSMRRAANALAALSARSVQGASDEDVRAWADRHGLDGFNLTDCRAAFEDAQSFNIVARSVETKP